MRLRWLKPFTPWAAQPAPEVAPAPLVPPAPGLRPEASGGLRLDTTQRAAEAARLLNNAVLMQALAELEQESIKALVDTKTNEREKREDYYNAVRAIAALRQRLDSYRLAGRIKAERDAA